MYKDYLKIRIFSMHFAISLEDIGIPKTHCRYCFFYCFPYSSSIVDVAVGAFWG